MHKGVIILTKAEDRQEAIESVRDFLEAYGEGDVWDWYTVGGRWNNTLAPQDKLRAFSEKADSILVKSEGGWFSQNEVDDKQEELQKAWEASGLEGLNSYCNHYQLPGDGNIYDVMPLSQCIDTVKSWIRDLEKEKEELWNSMVKAKAEAEEGKYNLTGYYAGQYKDAEYGNFCFDTNVYNATEEEAERVPEDVTGYWAVMIDMHN